MLVSTQRRLFESRARLSGTAVIESFVDPLAIVGSLFVSAELLDATLSKQYLIVAFIAFAANFPGRAFLSGSRRIPTSRVFVEWAVFAAALLAFGYASGYLRYFPVAIVFLWLLLAPVAVIATRGALARLLPRLLAAESWQRSAVIVGCNPAGLHLARNLAATPLEGIRCVGFFDDRRYERLRGIEPRQLLGKLSDLAAFVARTHIDHIYVTLPMASQPRVVQLLESLGDSTASIFFVPDVFVTELIQGRMDEVGDMPVLAVRDTPLDDISALAKRLLDIVAASALVVLFSPLLLTSAVLVKLSSPGPVIFRQRRYGLDGEPIIVYKFRTMTVTEDGERQYTQVVPDDPRLTRVGARLRQWSLDELPQLFNVLRGEMSLVGPRPHAVAVNEQYRRLIPDYMVRHKVKPGITGWAQVHGYRGGDDLESMRKRIAYDLEYLRDWSIGLDILIVLRTARILLSGDRRAF